MAEDKQIDYNKSDLTSTDFTTPILIQLYFELEEAKRLRSGKQVENEIKQEIEEVLKGEYE